jgi:Mrp family chromosome partitioning ATPase
VLDETRESFRKVADLLSHLARQQSVRTVVFTGVTPRCGTTTAAVAVAKELARLAGLRTLLVDMNMRRPGVAKSLRGDITPIEESWESLQSSTQPLSTMSTASVAKLRVLAPAMSPQASVSAELVKKVVDRAAQDFDIIIFDTPPVLGYADAFVAAGVTQALVLVVEAGQTPFEVIDRIKHEVGVRGITLLGAVLNKHRRFIPGWIYRVFAR